MSVHWPTRRNRLGWEQTDTWQHPQSLLTVAGGNFPNFMVMFSKKVEQSRWLINWKKWPKRPRHAYIYPSNSAGGYSIIILWNFWSWERNTRDSMRRNLEVGWVLRLHSELVHIDRWVLYCWGKKYCCIARVFNPISSQSDFILVD